MKSITDDCLVFATIQLSKYSDDELTKQRTLVHIIYAHYTVM